MPERASEAKGQEGIGELEQGESWAGVEGGPGRVANQGYCQRSEG